MSSRDTDRDTRLETRAKTLFDRGVASLDGHTRAKLADARVLALAASPRRRAFLFGSRQLIPAAAAAVSLVVAVAVWQDRDVVSPPVVETAPLDDLEILLAEEELEMIEELDFYTWLDEQSELDPPNGSDDNIG
jgi:hypothetical protein